MARKMTEGAPLTTLLRNALIQSEALQKHVEDTNNLVQQVKLENEGLAKQLQLLQQSKSEVTCAEHIMRIDQLMKENGRLRRAGEAARTCELGTSAAVEQLDTQRLSLEQHDHNLQNQLKTPASVNCMDVDVHRETHLQDGRQRLIAISSQLEAATETVQQLTRENASLRARLERNQQLPDLSAQLDSLFKQNIEKQAENDQLKVKLKQLRNKYQPWRLSREDFINPGRSPDELERKSIRAAELVPDPTPDLRALQATPEPQAGQKRLRIRSPAKPPLREMAGNARLQSTPSSTVRYKRSPTNARATTKVDGLAEDGENHATRLRRPTGRSCSTPAKAAVTHRLENLLFTPAPDTPLLGQTKTPNPLSASRQPYIGPNKTKPASLAKDQDFLRAKPVTQLSLGDFKVNPRYSGGESFAVVEVVRNKERRECLAGCTKAECCGANFKALATSLPQLLNGISDEELLVEFLGPGRVGMMKDLTPLAKANLVAEARTKKLADTFGKMHRSAFDQAPSPPGYWNTEMPGSQEELENRANASLCEKEEIERRYREAMKSDGRWLFVDE